MSLLRDDDLHFHAARLLSSATITRFLRYLAAISAAEDFHVTADRLLSFDGFMPYQASQTSDTLQHVICMHGEFMHAMMWTYNAAGSRQFSVPPTFRSLASWFKRFAPCLLAWYAASMGIFSALATPAAGRFLYPAPRANQPASLADGALRCSGGFFCLRRPIGPQPRCKRYGGRERIFLISAMLQD